MSGICQNFRKFDWLLYFRRVFSTIVVNAASEAVQAGRVNNILEFYEANQLGFNFLRGKVTKVFAL